MQHKRFSNFVGEKAFYDKTRPHRPKMNCHPTDRNGRMYWCNCCPGIRIDGRKGRWLGNFWQERQINSRYGGYKIKI